MDHAFGSLPMAAPDNPRLAHILSASDDYSRALLHLYDELDIAAVYAGQPEHLVARLVVAEVVGGVALPSDGAGVGALGPNGERIMVFALGTYRGFKFWYGASMAHECAEMLALVVFDAGVPIAVHLIPVDRLEAVYDAFGLRGGPFAGSPSIGLFTHCDFMLEPLKAAAAGVSSYDLCGYRDHHIDAECG
ncbi:MAG: hypothetical protein WCI74_14865 [Actinomycetes bacterium]